MASIFDGGKASKGYALVVVVSMLALLLFIGAGILRLVRGDRDISRNYKDLVTAYYIAEGGLYKTLDTLRQDPGFGSDGRSLTFPLGDGRYSVKIASKDDDILDITIDGRSGQGEVRLRALVEIEIQEEEETLPGQVQVKLLDFVDNTPI